MFSLGSSKLRPVRVAVSAMAYGILLPAAFAAAPLFPTPIHLRRQVQDPISEKASVVDEYGYGNRLIAVRGPKTSIADYDKGELIEIDREAGTYSITRFEELAKAAQAIEATMPDPAPRVTANAVRRQPLKTMGSKITVAGRNAEFFEGEVEGAGSKQTIEVGIDRSVLLSKEALEVLLGAAYPGTQRKEHEIVVSAAAASRRGSIGTNAAGGEDMYALPIEQTIRHDLDGRTLEFRSSVTRIGTELPPSDVITIPAGARLVVSRIVTVQRELEQLDHPAGSVLPQKP